MLKRFCYLMLCVSFLHSEETDEVMYHYFILPPSFQNMIQVFGSEYGYNFISNLSGPNHIAFDIGYLGLSSSRPHAFGTKARYEYEYGRNHFHRFGIEAYYAPIALNILIDTSASLYLLYIVKKDTKISYFKTIQTIIKIVLCTVIMVMVLSILNLFIPSYSHSRMMSILYIILYGIVGMATYFFVAYKSKTIDNVFGNGFVQKIFEKLKNLNKKTVK